MVSKPRGMATVTSAPRNEKSQLADVVRQLGGPSAIARVFRVNPEAICNWTARDEVPPSRQLDFWRLCSARGIPWHPPGYENLRLVEAGANATPPNDGAAMFSQAEAAAA